MKFFFIILLFIASALTLTVHGQEKYNLVCEPYLIQLASDSLHTQVGIKEKTGNNDGEVEKYLKAVGLGKGYPYCVAGLYWCYWVNAKKNSDIPFQRTALAQGQFNYAKKHGQKVPYKPAVNDWLIWRLGNTVSGHGEWIDSIISPLLVRNVGFNTSNGLVGSKREGNGVFYVTRSLVHPMSRLIPKGLIGVLPKYEPVFFYLDILKFWRGNNDNCN